ncbi:aldehyde oxidase [Chromatiales bacterium (ex Bugula neritina AB1)]|nr:aldehyde oxidase [Chromatiales bacterium (ex Bugula neritina AB1)]
MNNLMEETDINVSYTLNGRAVSGIEKPLRRLSDVLRNKGLTGTKVGCDAGDCGACTVLLDGVPVCSCLVAVGQIEGCSVETVESLEQAVNGCIIPAALQQSFLKHGAAQCGICTPGMLIAATHLLRTNSAPSTQEVNDALGGVLCRCTGYSKIVDAVVDAPNLLDSKEESTQPPAGAAIGARLQRLDGAPKVNGQDLFGADVIPPEALRLRIIRSPHHSADFTFGDTEAWLKKKQLDLLLTAADIPGINRFGVIPPFADQPVFAEQRVRFRGEAIAAVVGSSDVIESLETGSFPVEWIVHEPSLTPEEALHASAMRLHPERLGNVLVRGLVQRGDAEGALNNSKYTEQGSFSTPFIEHAYIEPEAGFAQRAGNSIEIYTCTQTAGMTREELAAIMGLAEDQVRVRPTSVGGGFGSKLDLSLQPYLCLAAWKLDRPVGGIYSRRESMQSTTKRHPSQIEVRVGCDANGKLTAVEFAGTFNTGAYASWGPTVANRVPIHASGPFYVPNYSARSTAVHTNTAPAGAFRGFGVPQASVALESVLDRLADKMGLDRLEFRLNNALDNNQPTGTGQVFSSGVGIRSCLQALQPAWDTARQQCEEFNNNNSRYRKGYGIATCWYGCGNTSLANPSTMKLAISRCGKIVLHQGAIDLGQGASTVVAQIAADTLGVAVGEIHLLGADTAITPDAGKTSASRQTFVSGKAAYLAARLLRQLVLREVNASDAALLAVKDGVLSIEDNNQRHVLKLAEREPDEEGYVFCAIETYDPPTSELDENGQGNPYAQYGYGAQLVELTVDIELGSVTLDRLTSAHDVGRAINPLLVEGQIEGGATQGIGMALMEEFVPGVSENLHDYLIPTIGDVPEFVHHIVEVPDAEGPYGAKGLGEHVLIPTAPAILNAIRDATGAEINHLPATPDKILAAIQLVRGQQL